MRALAPRFVPAPAAPPPAAPQRELSGADAFREALFVLRRRKWAIVGTLVLVMAAAILGVTRLVPVYTATAVVSVGERKMQVMDLENVLSGLRTDEETIQTEVQVLVSNRVLRDTVRDLHLDRIPELNRSLEGPPSAWRAALGSLEARAAALLRPRGAPPAALPATPADGADAAGGADDATPAEIRTMSAVRARLRVEPIGRSRAIEIAFSAQDPTVARNVANKIADLYLVQQLEAQAQASGRAEDWLRRRIAAMRGELDDAERKVADAQAKARAEIGMGPEDIVEQGRQLNEELVKAQNDFDLQNAKLDRAETALRTKGPAGAGRLLDSRTVQDLEKKEIDLKTAGADIAEHFGPRHPAALRNAAEQASVFVQISAAMQAALATQRDLVGSLAARMRSLKTDLDTLHAKALLSQQAVVAQKALDREVETRKTVLESFVVRARQLEQTGLQEPDARIVSAATLPLSPSFPRVGILLAVAFAAGLGLAAALAAALEMLDRGIKTREDVEDQLMVPALGVLPRAARSALRRRRPEDLVLERPVSAYAESLRGILASLALARPPATAATLLFTSTLPREGKTVLVVSLARALAGLGQRVLVIDCDLRRPAAHARLGLANPGGVAEVVAGRLALDQAVRRDERSGVELLPAGRPARGREQAVLAGVRDLVRALREAGRYDVILVDAPPVLAVSDARLLAEETDACVYVVRWGRTSRQAARRGLRLLDGARMVGAVLTVVDPAAHRKYGICDEGSYPGARAYYAARP